MKSSSVKYLVIAIAVIVILFLVFGSGYRKPVPTGSASNDSYIARLHPAIQYDTSLLITRANKAGIPTRITSGYRTRAQQASLDKTKGAYAAAPGRSFHNYGLAVDISVKNLSSSQLKALVKIAKSLGFEWGGDWKTVYEPWHFQKRFDNTIDELQIKYTNGATRNGWVKL